MESIPYSSAVGSVMYSMISTRPDLAQAISVLSSSTTYVRLIYDCSNSVIDLVEYVDSDYTGDRDKRRSTSSYFFTIAGCCVRWKSQLQSVVALSTTEAEYIAVTEAIKEAIWLQGLLGEINCFGGKAVIYTDSQIRPLMPSTNPPNRSYTPFDRRAAPTSMATMAGVESFFDFLWTGHDGGVLDGEGYEKWVTW
ncbi:hypothetical protein EZV62_019314 [Acer yangbiense]|uniref:Reverse transcriptase Ty1/copia-type domain-containing protein n=1 Tax=Acer yangbiense TaxID=1000413 RepID=A0A5C7HAW8_9ROSI|nr:hypothetical protein EZV62_019314 [Acer yangbiense]